MKNSILREIFRRLANAPEIVVNDYLKELNDKDKEEAERLIKALKIPIIYTAKEVNGKGYVQKNGFTFAVEKDYSTAGKQAQKFNFIDGFEQAIEKSNINIDR